MTVKQSQQGMTEARAYTQKEIDALGAEGNAFKNPDGTFSYPIANVSDLKRAVRAVGRGDSSHNAIRKYIIKRAKALKQSALVPDSWASDGSISEANGGYWPTELRDTANDVFTALSGAINDALEGQFSSWSVYVMDWAGAPDGSDNDYVVIYYAGGDVYSAEFDFDADSKVVVDLDTAIKVRPVTQYIPRSERAADDPCSTCGGSGKIKGNSTECPDCGGSGEASGEANSANGSDHRSLTPNTLEWRRAKAPRKGDKEHRTFTLDSVELREADGESEMLQLRGYASVTDTPYIVGPYTETIARGSFKRTLGVPDLDVCLLINHSDLPIARTTVPAGQLGHMALSEDSHGLLVEADLDPTDPDVARVAAKMRAGLVTEMSFAFRVSDQEWSADHATRMIREVNLQRGDVSIVTNGASQATEVALRAEQALASIRHQWERFLEMQLELCDFMLDPVEDRAERLASDENHTFLMEFLGLFATGDDTMEEGQARMDDLLSLPNPDRRAEPTEPAEPAENDTTEQNSGSAPGESTSPADLIVVYNRSAEVRARLLLREARRPPDYLNRQSSSRGHRADA